MEKYIQRVLITQNEDKKKLVKSIKVPSIKGKKRMDTLLELGVGILGIILFITLFSIFDIGGMIVGFILMGVLFAITGKHLTKSKKIKNPYIIVKQFVTIFVTLYDKKEIDLAKSLVQSFKDYYILSKEQLHELRFLEDDIKNSVVKTIDRNNLESKISPLGSSISGPFDLIVNNLANRNKYETLSIKDLNEFLTDYSYSTEYPISGNKEAKFSFVCMKILDGDYSYGKNLIKDGLI